MNNKKNSKKIRDVMYYHRIGNDYINIGLSIDERYGMVSRSLSDFNLT